MTDAARIASLLTIHEDVDMDLLKAMDNWLGTQSDAGKLSKSTVYSTVAYFLAHEICDSSPTNDVICYMTELYADYIHQTAHAIRQMKNPPRRK